MSWARRFFHFPVRLLHGLVLSLRGFLTPPIPVGPTLALLAGANFLFVAGAVVMYADIPPAEFLNKAFAGTRAWCKRFSKRPEEEVSFRPTGPQLVRYKTGQAHDGFTLVTTEQGKSANLI